MGRRGIAAILAVILATALLIGGCGGGGDSASLTKAEFTKQTNEICEKGDKERKANFKAVNAPKPAGSGGWTEPEMEKVVTEVFVDPYNEMIAELKDVGLPEGEEEKAAAIFEAMEDGIEKVENDPIASLSGTEMFKEVDKLSIEYGLTGCVL